MIASKYKSALLVVLTLATIAVSKPDRARAQMPGGGPRVSATNDLDDDDIAFLLSAAQPKQANRPVQPFTFADFVALEQYDLKLKIYQALPPTQGFLPVGHPDVPAEVRQASLSVVQLFSYGKSAMIKRAPFEEGLAQMRADADFVSSLARTGMTGAIFIKIMDSALKACGDNSICDVPVPSSNHGYGSGFLMGDGSSLWTAFHVTSGFFDSATGELTKAKHLLFGVNGAGELIIDPYTTPIALSKGGQFTEQQIKMMVAGPTNQMNISKDYVEYSLPRPVGPPLKIAQDVEATEEMYSIGFPGCTQCTVDKRFNPEDMDELSSASREPEPDSDGKSLRVTRGFIIKGVVTPTGYVMTRKGDMRQGMSGGVTVNKAGAAIGINAAGHWELNILPDQNVDTTSYIMRPINWKVGIVSASND